MDVRSRNGTTIFHCDDYRGWSRGSAPRGLYNCVSSFGVSCRDNPVYLCHSGFKLESELMT